MTRFQVDLDLLDEVIRRLRRHHEHLEVVDARLTMTVGRLHDTANASALPHARPPT